MAVTGPDFISLQVRDLERSAAFYEQYLGLKRSDAGPPHAVVFDTKPIAFAVRDVIAGTDLDAIAQPGQGMALWLHAPDAQDIHDALAAALHDDRLSARRRAVRPHVHVRGPRRLPGDPPRPRLSPGVLVRRLPLKPHIISQSLVASRSAPRASKMASAAENLA